MLDHDVQLSYTARVPRILKRSAIGLTACLTLSCLPKPASDKDVADAAARRSLLKTLGEDVMLASYREFETRAQALSAAADGYASEPNESTRSAAQAAFREAMLAWERSEPFQVGPAADVTNLNPGSQGFRREIYAYPDAQHCVVDRGLANKTYEDEAGFGDAVFYYARGLSVIERLLFDTSNSTACAATDKVLTPEMWQALVDSDLTQRRARYVQVASHLVATRAHELVETFSSGFLQELSRAGSGSKLFPLTQDALNALTDSLFYIDYVTRDKKLGEPLGLTMMCTGAGACPTELPHSRLSKQAIHENLVGLRACFVGASGAAQSDGQMRGLSDLLRSIGADAVATDIEAGIDTALQAVEAIEGSLESAPHGSDSAARHAYDALQNLSDRLHTDFLLKLSLNPPTRPAGDND